jgi:pimeloyl-ACP methyl ester carboxylesterase
MSTAECIEKMVDIGSTQLRLSCAGRGTPTVVLEAGLGEGLDAWAKVQTQVAAFTRACAYDRAGVGKSGPGPKPRTSRQMVTELRALLSAAQIDGPYVHVGHSLGGLNAQLYAIEYPNEVAGLVLVDPSYPDMLVRLGSKWGKFRVSLFTTMSYASHAEGASKRDFETSCAQVAIGKLPDVPLIVVSAGQAGQLPGLLNALFPSDGWLSAFQAGQAALAQASSKGQHLIAEQSTHATIAQDELIVDAIRQVVEMVRGSDQTARNTPTLDQA